MKVVSDTSYQPRLLDNPDDPVNSGWTLAVIEPDSDDNCFGTFDVAAKVGTEFALTKKGPNIMRRLVVVVVTTTSIPVR